MADLVPYSQAATTSLVSTLQNSDLMALAREDNDSDTGYQSKVTRVDTIAKKVVKETDYSDLQTTSKTPIGAINEVNAKASQFDNMTATASGSIATFDNGGDDIPVSEFECEIVAQQASGTPTPDNPLPITGFSLADITVTDNDQITNLYTVSFGQTIYGGRLIYANGQWNIEATHTDIDLGTLSWTSTTLGIQNVWITSLPTGVKGYADNYVPTNILCEQYAPTSVDKMYSGISGISLRTSQNRIYCSRTDLNEPQGKLIAELATPTIIPITSATRIKTISGDNNIYSSTGDCELKYFTNKADSLAELIKAFVL